MIKKSKDENEKWVWRSILTGLAIIGGVAVFGIFASLLNLYGNSKTEETTAAAEQTSTDEATNEAEVEPTADSASTEDNAELSKESAQEETQSSPVQITVSAVGDCTLGSDENFSYDTGFDAYYEEYGSSYFFENVRSIFEEDDLTIINMEGTLTTAEEREDKQFAFKGDPSYTEILTGSSVEAANLANNHSQDYGTKSYEDTIQYLEDAGVTNFGYERTSVMDIQGIKVGLTGIYVLKDGMEKEEQVKENIDALKAKGAQLIIVSFHWGEEKAEYPNDTQQQLSHIAIDQGADLVVGHHPHVLQGIEKYNGKTIVYSLGNFCFGGNSNPSDMDTMIYQQTFSFVDGQIQADDVTNVIPCSVSSVSDYNNYQPTPCEGEESQRILDKIQERAIR